MSICISTDFLQAYAAMPKAQQKKTQSLIDQFQIHPEASGTNLEKLHAGKDMYSARIDQAWRAIIFHPSSSGTYVLAWAGPHDEAYRWAERSKIQVNKVTGALQVVNAPAEANAPDPDQSTPPVPAGTLLAGVKDKHLLRLGVPEEMLPTVRSLNTDADLEEAQPRLPQEAYEALLMLAMGYNLDEVFLQMEKKEEPASVDEGDIDAALEHEDSKRRFYVVHEAADLAELLNAPLEKWRVFLHPQQRRLVQMNANGPVRVLGGAGTGKTVAAMHRARYLAEKVFTKPTDRILFTTFTRNLAVDIQSHLRLICSPDTANRIEVINLDAWVSNFLRKQGFQYDIIFGAEDNSCWEQALASRPDHDELPEAFYRSEWDEVIQAQNITDVDQYLKAPRLGRGTRLSRELKRKVWTVFQEYRARLNETGKREAIDLMREARQLIAARKIALPYRSVVVDEAQDMTPEAFRLIRQIAPTGPNDLFIVGDAFQRIYRFRASLGKCGIDIRGRGKKLKINYRTTEETRRLAVRVLEGTEVDDLDGGKDDQKGYVSLLHGEAPEVRGFNSFTEEADYLADRIRQWQEQGSATSSICLVARTRNMMESYREALQQRGVDSYELKRDKAERMEIGGLRVATMHRVKGLEFDHVLIAGANDGLLPLKKAVEDEDDHIGQRNAETRERSLLYVALTRARKSASVSGYGTLSRFLQVMAKAAKA